MNRSPAWQALHEIAKKRGDVILGDDLYRWFNEWVVQYGSSHVIDKELLTFAKNKEGLLKHVKQSCHIELGKKAAEEMSTRSDSEDRRTTTQTYQMLVIRPEKK